MDENKVGKQLSLKAKIAMLLICPLIVIAICSVVIVITVGTVVDSEKYDFGATAAEALIPPAGKEEIGLAFDALIKEASLKNDVWVEKGISVSVSDIDGTMTEQQKSLLTYFSSSVSESVKGAYQTEPVRYGEDASGLYFGNVIPLIDEAEAVLNEDGSKICYTFSLTPENSDLAAQMKAYDDATVQSGMNFSTGACTIENITATPAGMAVYAESNRDNQLTKVELERKYNVEADMYFSQELSGLGSRHITFVCTVKESQNIKYAGISVKQDKISLEKNGFETLEISANMEEDAGDEDFSLIFTSSDPAVVKVDPNGMVEAVSESKEPVTVTATLTYLGNTYTDSCTVTVGIPVEGISVKPRKAEIKVGETAAFTAVLDPKDATVDTVIWISEDETVCTVDENGVATGVAAGKTRIIAVSEDGYFMSASEITVS